MFLPFTNPVTEKRHLASTTLHGQRPPLRTLCGVRVALLVPGGEPISGIAATCRRCLAKAGFQVDA